MKHKYEISVILVSDVDCWQAILAIRDKVLSEAEAPELELLNLVTQEDIGEDNED